MVKNIAIILCSGFGKRMESKIPKQFLELNGKPIICHTLHKFQKCEKIDEIIVVVSKEFEEYLKNNILIKYKFSKISNIVLGGKERFNSVYNALSVIKDINSIVLIHDGVRPFIKINYIETIIEKTKIYKACVLGVKAKDTIKICNNYIVDNTPNRDNVWIAQTPQAFEYSLIKKAYDYAIDNDFIGTDDSSFVENIGHNVKMILGDYCNIKITTPEDLKIGKLFCENDI